MCHPFQIILEDEENNRILSNKKGEESYMLYHHDFIT